LIHQLRPYLEYDCLATVTHALVTSRLDFCNTLYVGLPLKTVRILQLVQNRAARLLTGTGRYVHMTPVLQQLHWLPIEVRAQFKVLVMTYKALNGLGPGYLKERLRPYMPSRPLRSAGEALLREPSVKEIRRKRFLLCLWPTCEGGFSKPPEQNNFCREKMNWVGGSRKRIMITKERRKQKDFFEKKRLKSKMKMLRESPFQNSAVSLDLLNLYVVNQISTKKKYTGSIQKPVQVDINRGVKIPLRRHNVELPNSPEHRPPEPLLDDIQHRVQEEILENRRKYLSEKKNFQSQIPNIKSEDAWISKAAYRKRDFNDPDVDVPTGQYFQQLNSPEYRDIFGKSPKVTAVTDFGSSHSEEGLFGIVKDTLKTTQSENFQPIVSLFEEMNQHYLTTSASAYHPLVNRNIIDQLFTDSGRFENQKKDTQVADTVQNCLETRKCGRAEPNLNHLQIFELEEVNILYCLYLGMFLDPELSLEAQVTVVARSAFFQLRLVHQLRPYLENDCLVTVTHVLVTSRLDFCNALYVGLPLKTVRILQLVQNRAARLLTGTGCYVHMTPVLRQLHWLPIEVRAQFKVLGMTYKALNGLGPGYLKELLRPYVPACPLRSAGETLLQEPSVKDIRRDVYNFYDQHSKQERQRDDELQLNSQSPSYSPKQTDRYVSTTSDESEKEEQDGKASCLLEEYFPRNYDSPLSASRNTRSQCNCHLMGGYSAILCNGSSDTAEIQPLTEPAMNLRKYMLQKAGTELPDASFENKCANFKAKYNAWSQTETWAKGMEKSDAAVQCDLMQGCGCRNELSSVHSAEIVTSVSKIKTTGGQNIPADRAAVHSSSSDSVFTKNLSPEREHPTVPGKINQDIIDFIQVINKV
ncbi:hypothetical protein EYD10_07374, partial [Varanus komodoensis]